MSSPNLHRRLTLAAARRLVVARQVDELMDVIAEWADEQFSDLDDDWIDRYVAVSMLTRRPETRKQIVDRVITKEER